MSPEVPSRAGVARYWKAWEGIRREEEGTVKEFLEVVVFTGLGFEILNTSGRRNLEFLLYDVVKKFINDKIGFINQWIMFFNISTCFLEPF